MKTFFLFLFRPIKAFNKLNATDSFSIISFIIVLILMLVNLILMIPINEKVINLSLSSMYLSRDQIDTSIQVMHKMRYLQVAGSEILYIIMFLFNALLLYAFVYITKNKITFKKTLQLIVYSYFIVVIGDLLNTVFLYIRGIDAISNANDISLVGLNMLTSVEQIGATLYTFLSYINPFQIAFVVLLSIGLKIFIEVKYVKSLIICIIFWLITVLIPTLSVYYSQITIEKAGII